MSSDLKLIVLNSMKSFGEKVDKLLQKKYKSDESFIVSVDEIRFANGEGKVKLNNSVRGCEVYILADVGNYALSYESYGKIHYKTPDEHFQDIKRTISAIRGNAVNITVIMPLLYESRQHKRNGRESLDCAIALQELESLGVDNIITFDVHDPNVQNAIPLLPFDNFFPTNVILKDFVTNNVIDFDKLLVISPDTGAMDRCRYYAGMLECDLGVFYKRRDYSRLVNGKNPIVEHRYLGKEAKGLEYIIVDDMIASGGSIIDILSELYAKKAKKSYVITTFALFTEGVKMFDEAYEAGLLTKIYTTNLTYIPEEYYEKEWLEVVDCSKFMATVIDTYHNKRSVSSVLNGKKELFREIAKVKENRKLDV